MLSNDISVSKKNPDSRFYPGGWGPFSDEMRWSLLHKFENQTHF